MKTLIFAVAVLISFPLQSVRGASPEGEASFVTAVRQAFYKQDINALFALTCWDRMPDKYIKSQKNQDVKDLTLKVSDMTLVDPLPNHHQVPLLDKNGVEYLPNLSVIKHLKIVFVIDGRLQSVLKGVGEKDGKLYFVGNAPVK